MKICEIFLAKDAVDPSGQKYDAQKIDYLRRQMAKFVKMCGFAIKLNKSLISAEHIPFQQMVEMKYKELVDKTKVYLDG